ncbi:hypothetical protein [Moheibacter lacus]|uniref:Cytochrome B n=1 Tax=Moheibacter lacus TaxID=2745851 RepID=A0A838ZJG6_9FLAO|nr:hypothetical protein [Moheibacter lacus]MBA5629398.1 hypothetical protein [Moheibacter lacus]
MYKILQHFHSGWAYLTLTMGVLFFVLVGYYAINKKARNNFISKISFFTTLTFHLQLVIGVVLYFVSPYAKWTENTMKDETNRLYAMEHPLMMFAAVVLITIANSKLKKSEVVKMTPAILGLLALACVVSRIPWDAWLS